MKYLEYTDKDVFLDTFENCHTQKIEWMYSYDEQEIKCCCSEASDFYPVFFFHVHLHPNPFNAKLKIIKLKNIRM